MIAEVLIEYGNINVDKCFDYFIPDNLLDKVKVGIRVTVNFNNKSIEGFVLNIKDTTKVDPSKMKYIEDVVDKEVTLTSELLELGKWMSNRYLSTLIYCYQAMLPKALKADVNVKINKKYVDYYKLKDDSLSFGKRQQELIDYLKVNGISKRSDLAFSSNVIKSLLDKEAIEKVSREVYRLEHSSTNKKNVSLTTKQQEIVDTIINTDGNFLLRGVTGSGKTLIYLKIIEYMASLGKTSILLLPEIALTVQTIDYFKDYFHFDVAVLHSGLSEGEKYDEYRKIQRDEVKLVIGARSAIFAPLDNIGIIIIDEEQSSSYKQADQNPRYDAREIAIYRAKYHNAKCLLASATPSVYVCTRALRGYLNLITLDERYNKNMPTIKIVDLKKEKNYKDHFSSYLKDAIAKRLAKHEQVILLLNRKGYANYVTCSNCHHTLKCPNCDITLTYYKETNRLQCNYCGYTTSYTKKCPNCKENALSNIGVGTEKIEEELNRLFPSARVKRMDLATMTRKNSYEKVLNSFKRYEYDILLGTQMIAKGLDFPRVTLVGIINADTSLLIPNYKASEDTYDLLVQVAGRSGRSSLIGECVIQTYNPDHYAISLVRDGNYLDFYKEEMNERRLLGYPPYYFMVYIKISSKDRELIKEADNIKRYLVNNLPRDFIFLGPKTNEPFKLDKRYIVGIVIKYKNEANLREVLNEIRNIYKTKNEISLDIIFNPDMIF